MCGIAAVFGRADARACVEGMIGTLGHRGPDATGVSLEEGGALGHTRLSIVGPGPAGAQPMASRDGRYVLTYNGEIYNDRDLAARLGIRTAGTSDTELVVEAWARSGSDVLDSLLGMFAFVVWDRTNRTLTAVRDRFGVKPLYYATPPGGAIVLASEIKAIHRAGIDRRADEASWATFLATGRYPTGGPTFWENVQELPAGCRLEWTPGRAPVIERWYDLESRVDRPDDDRTDREVRAELDELLTDAVGLRFRSDVPVGFSLSGGLDSSLLLSYIGRSGHDEGDVRCYTFVTGDDRYDELPWVEQLLQGTHHPLTVCPLRAADVPALATEAQALQDEPFGGLPTLAYAELFRHARAHGTLVVLDGQGLDEQWAGYDYYRGDSTDAPLVQGSRSSAVRPDVLSPAFASLAQMAPSPPRGTDGLRALQLRDLLETKIPRALRFNDRASMAASVELREPFLDHRLVELALVQPSHRKIDGETGKVTLRRLAMDILPDGIRTAPKRPLQTPQREWLRGPLAAWTETSIDAMLESRPDWFIGDDVRQEWTRFRDGDADNSFFVWQWISAALLLG